MRVLLTIFSLVCASTLLAQTNWEYDITDQSHTILFPATTTEGVFEYGDYMGVFYEDNDALVCAGYSEYTEENMALTAFGASFSFSGFTEGQLFHFKHWSAASNSENVFYVNYISLDFPNESHFVNNGMSGVSSILDTQIFGCMSPSAVNYSVEANVDDNSCVSILQNSYNLSLDSISDLHNLYNLEFENLSDSMSSVVSQLESTIVNQNDSITDMHSVYNSELDNLNDSLSFVDSLLAYQEESISGLHSMYNYEFNYLNDSLNLIISQLDSTLALQLDTIENQTNIIINLAEEIDFNIDSIYTLNQIIDGLDQELALKVDTINFLNQPIVINLVSGWNMIGYSVPQEMNLEDGFLLIEDEITIVKDYLGNAYLPDWNFNAIGNLIPGQGYQIRMINASVFSFPNP
tara:strand:- start:431 stop:1648 length:1218 start_codon:yes stop_codon:yes gene_type:complete